MNDLRLVVADPKHLAIRGIDAVVAHCLYELPEILRRRDQPRIRERLFPGLVAGADTVNEEWRQWVGGDLEHLFAEAGMIVTRDLTALDQGEVRVPFEHAAAWISALNQARVILGEQHRVTEEDMKRSEFDFDDPRQQALLEIHVLGYLLQLFVEHEQQDSL